MRLSQALSSLRSIHSKSRTTRLRKQHRARLFEPLEPRHLLAVLTPGANPAEEGGEASWIRIQRNNDYSDDLTVDYVIEGTATPGVDTTLPASGSMHLAPGLEFVQIPYLALEDEWNESNPGENIIVRITDYHSGSNLDYDVATMTSQPISDSTNQPEDAPTQSDDNPAGTPDEAQSGCEICATTEAEDHVDEQPMGTAGASGIDGPAAAAPTNSGGAAGVTGD